MSAGVPGPALNAGVFAVCRAMPAAQLSIGPDGERLVRDLLGGSMAPNVRAVCRHWAALWCPRKHSGAPAIALRPLASAVRAPRSTLCSFSEGFETLGLISNNAMALERVWPKLPLDLFYERTGGIVLALANLLDSFGRFAAGPAALDLFGQEFEAERCAVSLERRPVTPRDQHCVITAKLTTLKLGVRRLVFVYEDKTFNTHYVAVTLTSAGAVHYFEKADSNARTLSRILTALVGNAVQHNVIYFTAAIPVLHDIRRSTLTPLFPSVRELAFTNVAGHSRRNVERAWSSVFDRTSGSLRAQYFDLGERAWSNVFSDTNGSLSAHHLDPGARFGAVLKIEGYASHRTYALETIFTPDDWSLKRLEAYETLSRQTKVEIARRATKANPRLWWRRTSTKFGGIRRTH